MEAALIGVCVFLWGVRLYLVAMYRTRQRTKAGRRWMWLGGTPDWVTLVMPWVNFLSWLALAVLIGLLAYDSRQRWLRWWALPASISFSCAA